MPKSIWISLLEWHNEISMSSHRSGNFAIKLAHKQKAILADKEGVWGFINLIKTRMNQTH